MGAPSEGNSAFKHQQVLVVVVSVTVLVIRVCPCTVCKRHLAFRFSSVFFKERLISAPPPGKVLGCTAAERRPERAAGLRRRREPSPPEDAPSQRRVPRWTPDPKVQFWKNGQHELA